MAYIQIDESADESVKLRVERDEFRIRYGKGASLTLSMSEAFELAAELVGGLAVIDSAPVELTDEPMPMDVRATLRAIGEVRSDIASATRKAAERAQQQKGEQ